ncbi:MAG TPA: dihydroorotate dehydrogenase-like protein [Bacteroidota bacterium]|nr:dihydroorotate dehydrogenase-like protein [Bacteroidota bacterium]
MDISTTYLGLKLKNPLVPSAGPLSHSLDSLKKLEDNGAAAIVMYSLFEEQLIHEEAELHHYVSSGAEISPEASSYFPRAEEYHLGPREYLELVRKGVESLDIPLIGSLNGTTPGGWTEYAKMIEEAGADAIELNVYYLATDPFMGSTEVENRYIEVLRAVKKTAKIPVAVKLSPFFSSLAHIAKSLVDEGANGLVLFNRFYQPDIDLTELEVTPNVVLSDSSDNRLPMRWIAVLSGKIQASLAATSGIHTAEDVIKMIMAGADVAMMCSALLKNGHAHLTHVLREMERWMAEREYISVSQMKGSMSHRSVADPSAFERANYMKALNKFRVIV